MNDEPHTVHHPPEPSPATVLVVEDVPELRAMLRAALEREGFAVETAADGESGLRRARERRPDVVVLDVGLPGVDGLDVCRRLRGFTDAYVVMLTARAGEVDRVVGLMVGADDYVTKPFSSRELVARIRAMLRRPRTAAVTRPAPRVGLRIDADAREVDVDGRSVTLTRLEFDLLAALARRPRHVLGRQELLDAVWGPGWIGDPHVVEVHVSNLRRKLDAVSDHRYIATVRGVGYRLEPSPAEEAA